MKRRTLHLLAIEFDQDKVLGHGQSTFASCLQLDINSSTDSTRVPAGALRGTRSGKRRGEGLHRHSQLIAGQDFDWLLARFHQTGNET